MFVDEGASTSGSLWKEHGPNRGFQGLIPFPFFSTIVLFKNQPFSPGKIRIPGLRMDMEGIPRRLGVFSSAALRRHELHQVFKTLVPKIPPLLGAW